MIKILRHLIGPATFGLIGALTAPVHAAETINVAVANSTCIAMQRVGELFAQRHGDQINYQCKSSGLLAKGLKGGAISADIYVSASREWMDFMIESGLINPEQVTNPWGNELVVIAARSSTLEHLSWSDLADPKVKTIMIGDPGTAPFGRYAKEAMQNTAIWDAAKSKVTTKMHITLLADAMAIADSSTVGIMFRSNITPHHKILLDVDESWHEPIHYYAAPLAGAADKPVVAELMRFIQDREARMIFEAEGFRVNAP